MSSMSTNRSLAPRRSPDPPRVDARDDRSDPRATGAFLLGGALGIFMFVGRWSMGRLEGEYDADWLWEPRLWLAVVIVALGSLPVRRDTTGPWTTAQARGLLTSLAFFGYFALTLAWAPDADLGLSKAYELGLLLVVQLAAIRGARHFGVRRVVSSLLLTLAGLGGALALVGVVSSSAGAGRLAILGGGPNTFGRNMGLLAAICLGASLRRRAGSVAIAIGLVALALVVMSGSRGAMIAASGGVLVLAYGSRARFGRLTLFVLVLVAGGAVFLTYSDLGQTTLFRFQDRFLRLLIEERHVGGREVLYEDAIAMGLRHPVAGGGLNAFQALGHGVYPHNVFLEAFAEGGILGVTVLVLFLARPLWLLGARRDDVLVPLACFAVVLLSSQFSGNFFDTRGVFLLAAFLTMTEGRPSPGAAPPGALREGPGRPDEAPAP